MTEEGSSVVAASLSPVLEKKVKLAGELLVWGETGARWELAAGERERERAGAGVGKGDDRAGAGLELLVVIERGLTLQGGEREGHQF